MGSIRKPHPFSHQMAELEAALHAVLVDIPAGTTFAITITEQDTDTDPGVFNIYTRSPEDRERLIIEMHFDLFTAEDEGESFVSYRLGPLMVSFIDTVQEGENNG